MKKRVFPPVFLLCILLFFYSPALKLYSRIGSFRVNTLLNSSVHLWHSYNDAYYLYLPVFGGFDVSYMMKGVIIHGGIGYYGELKAGEIFIEGREGDSVIRMGRVTEDWNISYSQHILKMISVKNNYFPNNVFYSRILSPVNLFYLDISGNNYSQEVVISSERWDITYINDPVVGLRSSVFNDFYTLSIGYLGNGYPLEPQFFIQLNGKHEAIREWLELSFEYIKNNPHGLRYAIGMEKSVANSRAVIELSSSEDIFLLFTGGIIRVGDNSSLRIKGFLDLKGVSAALCGEFSNYVNNRFMVYAGCECYLGRGNSYFSPRNEDYDNNNSLYLGFKFVIGNYAENVNKDFYTGNYFSFH